ncbi:unnamed protein product [Caenorhabditis angaria]|uniref:Uncharacterized protein n=1 Tax=Caenorhabditis angaria TaxID=860376 RepID=A0A9P1MWN8_9PELO|nr:unnamed protein product [Caenorhabditis angaria]
MGTQPQPQQPHQPQHVPFQQQPPQQQLQQPPASQTQPQTFPTQQQQPPQPHQPQQSQQIQQQPASQIQPQPSPTQQQQPPQPHQQQQSQQLQQQPASQIQPQPSPTQQQQPPQPHQPQQSLQLQQQPASQTQSQAFPTQQQQPLQPNQQQQPQQPQNPLPQPVPQQLTQGNSNKTNCLSIAIGGEIQLTDKIRERGQHLLKSSVFRRVLQIVYVPNEINHAKLLKSFGNDGGYESFERSKTGNAGFITFKTIAKTEEIARNGSIQIGGFDLIVKKRREIVLEVSNFPSLLSQVDCFSLVCTILNPIGVEQIMDSAGTTGVIKLFYYDITIAQQDFTNLNDNMYWILDNRPLICVLYTNYPDFVTQSMLTDSEKNKSNTYSIKRKAPTTQEFVLWKDLQQAFRDEVTETEDLKKEYSKRKDGVLLKFDMESNKSEKERLEKKRQFYDEEIKQKEKLLRNWDKRPKLDEKPAIFRKK